LDVILGIDLGTTQHRVALWRDGRAEVFPNRFSGHRLPAELSANGAGGWQIGSWKRRLGTDAAAEREIAGILRHLIEDAVEAGGHSIRGALLAVPASFTERQRALLREAARQADVPAVRLLDEAVASIHGAALAPETSLVFSWGAAFLQAAVLRPEGTGWRLLASEGEPGGAGNEIDSDFMPFLSGRIFGAGSAVTLDADGARKLHGSAERFKMGLSRRAKEEQEIDPREFVSGWEQAGPVPVAISRQELEQLLAPRIGHVRKKILQAVSGAGIQASQLLQILLSGGSTRMPFLDGLLEEIFPKAKLVRAPDSSIARGAAVFGGNLSQDEWKQAAERAAEAARENEQAARMQAPSQPVPPRTRAGKWLEHLTPSLQEAENLWDLGRRTESLERFRRFLDQDARTFFAHLLYRAGKDHFRNDRFSEAVKALEEAYRYTPDDKEVEHYYHVSLNRHASRSMENGDLAAAWASIEIGLKLDSKCEGCRQLAKQIHTAMQRGRMPGMAFKRKRK